MCFFPDTFVLLRITLQPLLLQFPAVRKLCATCDSDTVRHTTQVMIGTLVQAEVLK